MIEPRPYQKRAKVAVLRAWREHNRALVVMPTGTGKTIMFGSLIQHVLERTNLRCLVVAHRDELITQTVKSLRLIDAEMPVGIVKGKSNEWQERVVVASVQSLHKKRREKITDPFDVIVIDEAHHAQANNTYGKVIQWSEEACSTLGRRCRTLGVTATPFRGDKRGLGAVFETLAFTYTIPAAVEDQVLCPLKAYQIRTKVNLDGCKVSAGDFNLKELTAIVNTENTNSLVASAYLRYCKGVRAVAFCVDVKHAQELARTMDEKGIRAKAVWGSMPLEERRSVLQELRDGSIDVVTNCMVLTEGFDLPELGAVLLCRPTLSLVVYQQQVGRVTRTAPGKEQGIVLDFTFNSKRMKLASLADLKFPGARRNDGEDFEPGDGSPRTVFVEIKPKGQGLRSFRVELFSAKEDAISWTEHQFQGRSRRFASAKKIHAIIEETKTGHVVYLVPAGKTGWEEVERHFFGQLQDAVDLAERRLVERGALAIAKASASWKQRAPSKQQLSACKKWGVVIPDNATSGEVSALLGYKMAVSAIRKWQNSRLSWGSIPSQSHV